MRSPNSWLAALVEDWHAGGFGIYIHWPFCDSKCPYCDFNSHVARTINHDEWRAAYLSEIERYAKLVPNRVLHSIFFGGGTPSLMAPETVAAILEKIRFHWPLANHLEVTLEANPGSVEAGRFADYAQAGVNRVSLGVQALNDPDLRRLGRLHSVAEAHAALDIANQYFDRVSFDLIYARQNQTPQDWEAELTRALSYATGHLSLYQLTIEDGTAFGDLYNAGRLRGLPPDDTSAQMYDITQERCLAAGYPAYEVSNHALPGQESRHNLIYWRYGDYIGIGPGAHGRLTIDGQRFASDTVKNPTQWLQNQGANIHRPMTPIAPIEQGNEYLMMGLRIAEGIDMSRYARIAGQPLPQEHIEFLENLDMIQICDDRLMATQKGRLVLNSVLRELIGETD